MSDYDGGSSALGGLGMLLFAGCVVTCAVILLVRSGQTPVSTKKKGGGTKKQTTTKKKGDGGKLTTTKKIAAGNKRVFAPYVMLETGTSSLLGTRSDWVSAAFVEGYANGKIRWDAQPEDAAALERALKGMGGRVIVSFGGAAAGQEKDRTILSELAGQYADHNKLSAAYEAVADALGATRLDFDVEEDALKDTASIARRHKALALLQKRRPDVFVQFTVPSTPGGLAPEVKSMLQQAKKQGVRIGLVNLMTMYMTDKKTDMAKAVLQALAAAKPLVKSLGAKAGITVLIGKNPDKPYTHEEFTLANAASVLQSVRSDPDVKLLAYWNLNMDVAKHKGAYAKAWRGYGG